MTMSRARLQSKQAIQEFVDHRQEPAEPSMAGPAAPVPVLPGPDTGVLRQPVSDPLGGGAIPGEMLSALRRSNGRGAGLPASVAAPVERALGHDMSAVRVHTDPAADRLARSVQSVAFTQGADIYFTRGSYAPGTTPGSRLLAHELAHVTQRSRGSEPQIGRADDPAETAADRIADRIAPILRRSAHDRVPVPDRTPELLSATTSGPLPSQE
ncbi:MAG: DUF4157 domain-containing protein [Nakamurella sp.]